MNEDEEANDRARGRLMSRLDGSVDAIPSVTPKPPTRKTATADAAGARSLFRGGHVHEAMSELCYSFHALHYKNPPGVQPWDPKQLLAWCKKMRGKITRYEYACAHFVLLVWNAPEIERELGKLDVMDALAGWDDVHRAAFIEWARDPWWP